MKFCDKIIGFNSNLQFTATLPPGIKIMNPFTENPDALDVSSSFYKKFYDDDKPRNVILGINPGRFGAGVTGIPFTDTKRLQQQCGIEWNGQTTHETSSVFIYKMIDAYGGPEKFYNNYFINSVSPLGFVIRDKKGKEKNYNYYDNAELLSTVEPFIISSIQKILCIGVHSDVCFCLEKGKNFNYLKTLNQKMKFFGEIIPLEHPRYIMQYRRKKMNEYIHKYVQVLV